MKTITELLKVLKSAKVEVLNEDTFGELNKDYHLNRDVYFMLGGHKYKINWYCNLCTLTTPCGVDILFTKVEHSGTWPNHYKRNLQFKYGIDTVCIIGVEKYEKH